MQNQYSFNCKLMDVDKQIDAWLYSNELKDIVEAFKGTFPDTDNRYEAAKWLLEFSKCWDYRNHQKHTLDKKTGENTRWQISSSKITEMQKNAIANGIHALGLIGIYKPSETDFDYIIALGGARFSCLYRTRYMHKLINEQGITAKAAVLLSGMRQISESERPSTDTYAPNAATEYDLINTGGEQAFELPVNYREEIYHNENPNRSWAMRTYDTPTDTIPLFSVSGPSSDPQKRRANSADTYKFFFKKFNVRPGQKLLLVTSQIYVPYQQIEALRTLAIPNSLYIETVGFPVEWSGQLQGMMEPANYLQEIRSTIQAINRYLDTVKI